VRLWGWVTDVAITAIGTVRFAALAGAPPLPEGYHFEAMRDTPNGVRVDVHFRGARIFEIAGEYSFDRDTTRFAARVIEDRHPRKRAFNHPQPWVEFDDITTLLQAMLARHRIGVKTNAPM